MKTSVIYPIALMSLMTVNSYAQRAVRRDNNEKESQRTSNQVNRETDQRQHQNDNQSGYHYTNDSHHQQQAHNQHNKKENKHQHNKQKQYHQACGEDNRNYHHDEYAHHHDMVYYQSLPNKHYHRYKHNGMDYYHCNNQFYRYDYGYGYVRVASPFVMVAALPSYYTIRVIEGSQYLYYNGYFYMPANGGWMMVPEPVAPQPHFSVSIQF